MFWSHFSAEKEKALLSLYVLLPLMNIFSPMVFSKITIRGFFTEC